MYSSVGPLVLKKALRAATNKLWIVVARSWVVMAGSSSIATLDDEEEKEEEETLNPHQMTER